MKIKCVYFQSIVFTALSVFVIACSSGPGDNPDEEKKPNILIFSKTGAFRHESIEPGGEALKSYFAARDITSLQSEDATLFSGNQLSPFDVIIFLNTTGNILDSLQQESLVKHMKSGKGFVGIHSASDTEYDWPWYAGLVAAQFANHPDIQQATVVKVDTGHLSTKHLPDRWMRTDEWHNFRQLPVNVNVLLTLDETTYQGGGHGVNHPLAWYHSYDGGRSFYTAMGHTVESYQDTMFLEHIYQGVLWAGGK